MKLLVTGSAGHLGEALMRTLPLAGHEPFGLDIKDSAFTHRVGSIVDRGLVRVCLRGIDAIIHTATLHKPHVATHAHQNFIDTNITGTLNLLEEARDARIGTFLFTSTTSVFGRALTPSRDEPAAWITEDIVPRPKNIYGITKLAAENLCELFHRNYGLSCLILRTARFFPEADDRRETREAYADANAKVNEFLYRRADIEDVATAHLLAVQKAASIGFGRYIVSATTPFCEADGAELHKNAPTVVARYLPDYLEVYAALGWSMFPAIERVYDNTRARTELDWRPRHDFGGLIDRLRSGGDYRSALALAVGSKGYHDVLFQDGPYPV
jgi:UDP-glucose 4-epimerase